MPQPLTTHAAAADVLTSAEFATHLRTTDRQVRRMIEAGVVYAVNVGLGKSKCRYRIPRSELDRLLNPPTPTRGRHLRMPT